MNISDGPIGVGLVGYGLAGAILHAPILEALPDYRIVAVATSRVDAGTRRDAPAVVPDAEAMLALDAVELVIVVSPNESHAPIAAAALDAGRHVVIDKPMAPDIAACDALIDQAANADRRLSVYHNRRWDGDFLAASAEARRAPPALFAACWDRFRPDAPPGWRNEPRAGTGLLWDLGPHMIDQAIRLFGWPDAVTADIATQRADALSDDYFELQLQYGSRRAILSASSLIAAPRPRFALHGAGGSWWTEGLDPAEALLRGGWTGALADAVAALPPIAAFQVDGDGERVAQAVPPGDPFAFYRGMARAIRGHAPVPVDPIDARNVVALISAAHRGAAVPALRVAPLAP